jgi:hypothetical protein
MRIGNERVFAGACFLRFAANPAQSTRHDGGQNGTKRSVKLNPRLPVRDTAIASSK